MTYRCIEITGGTHTITKLNGFLDNFWALGTTKKVYF